MNAINHITSILSACGANPTVTTDKNGNGYIKVNAPEIKSCDTCAKRGTCKKDMGFMFNYCNTDYKPIERAKQ